MDFMPTFPRLNQQEVKEKLDQYQLLIENLYLQIQHAKRSMRLLQLHQQSLLHLQSLPAFTSSTASESSSSESKSEDADTPTR